MRTMYRWRWVAMSVAALATAALLGGLSMRAGRPTAEQRLALAANVQDQPFEFRLRSEPVDSPGPGSTTPLRVRLTNPHDVRIRIEALTGRVGEVSRPDCEATASDIVVGPHTGPPALPVTLAPRESLDVGTIPVYVPLAVSAACRTAVYRFIIVGTGFRLPVADSA
ncbi:hypothetical protein ACIA8K_28060 [Catenuloplanes sp. NPDC051500]|uniref:hypothetical protein n=1 Tax=Catenuloplanes sp. NPDC051500 TaxID=3363959 RepID=UPI0037952741